MSIRKISSLVGVFAITLCLTGCFNSTVEEPNETQVSWNAKNKISAEKQSGVDKTDIEDTDEEELE